MTIKEQIKVRAEKEYPNTHTLVQNALNHFMRIDRNSDNRYAYTKGGEDMLPVIEALEQDNARMREALEGLISLGRKDLSNPKYDAYFQTANESLNQK